jgi:5-methylcytosine-specific restriction enzyme A
MHEPGGHKRREFPQSVRKAAFIRCCREGTKPGIPQCESCGNELRAGGIIYEHDDPDGLGGEPTDANCKVYCTVCADRKTHEEDNPRMRKADAVLKATYDLKPARRQTIESRGFAKAPPQRKASSPIQKWRGYE